MMFFSFRKDNVDCLKMARTLFGKPLRTAYAFLVDGLAVESGSPLFKKQVSQIFEKKRPTQALFTHGHEDHAGNIDVFNRFGIVPHVHQNALTYLAAPPVIPAFRRFAWGQPAPGHGRPTAGIIETDNYTFRVIPSPGHSPDHICLYEEKEGWLFTGDLYLGERMIYLYESEDLTAMKDSLKILAGLDFATMFCSHRGPLQKGPDALMRKLNHIISLQERAADLQKKGYSRRKITETLLGREDYMYLISRGEFSKTALVKALLANE
ncbi:MAG: MBL fold metallo-hydrolase [Bacillota bacterium]|nr:MBL fold metallo-hydrolase [Bacillota bacterium]MDW7683292.1 MBL fold metallo-hydrolase [Bacillota bacterium]